MSRSETVWIVDDDRSIRWVLEKALQQEGMTTQSFDSADGVMSRLARQQPDVIISDIRMPGASGLDLLARIREQHPRLPVIIMTAHSDLDSAVASYQGGAFEYLPKPFDLKEVLAVVARALAAPASVVPAAATAQPEEQMPLIGRSVVMQDIYRIIARLTTSDLTVMISGESGTGKELVARALHEYGRRRAGPFVAINMAAVPRDLIESELFGHERGAFPGATSRVAGRFEQAAGGTLFLDEIGDMPPEAQTRLLRVLQDGEFTTVGGVQPVQANVRIIAATHRDLRQAIRAGTFREDLYYRLNVVPMRLPPLRERVEDIPLLARHFLNACQEEGTPAKMLDDAAMAPLQAYRWPGNVRELENLMRRLSALYPQETLGADLVEHELEEAQAMSTPATEVAARDNETLSDAVGRHIRHFLDTGQDGMPLHDIYDKVIAEVERPLITMTLSATRGNQIKAAAMLGLNRNTLRKKIRDLDIPVVRGGG